MRITNLGDVKAGLSSKTWVSAWATYKSLQQGLNGRCVLRNSLILWTPLNYILDSKYLHEYLAEVDFLSVVLSHLIDGLWTIFQPGWPFQDWPTILFSRLNSARSVASGQTILNDRIAAQISKKPKQPTSPQTELKTIGTTLAYRDSTGKYKL